jgi:hypothetical protein
MPMNSVMMVNPFSNSRSMTLKAPKIFRTVQNQACVSDTGGLLQPQHHFLA